jgi:hypothetical protein
LRIDQQDAGKSNIPRSPFYKITVLSAHYLA